MKRKIGLRMPKELCDKLRCHGGGAHSSPKGKRGYDRNRKKRIIRKES